MVCGGGCVGFSEALAAFNSFNFFFFLAFRGFLRRQSTFGYVGSLSCGEPAFPHAAAA